MALPATPSAPRDSLRLSCVPVEASMLAAVGDRNTYFLGLLGPHFAGDMFKGLARRSSVLPERWAVGGLRQRATCSVNQWKPWQRRPQHQKYYPSWRQGTGDREGRGRGCWLSRAERGERGEQAPYIVNLLYSDVGLGGQPEASRRNVNHHQDL